MDLDQIDDPCVGAEVGAFVGLILGGIIFGGAGVLFGGVGGALIGFIIEAIMVQRQSFQNPLRKK